MRSVVDLPRRDGALAAALEPLGGAAGRVNLGGLNPPAAALLLASLLDRARGGKLILLVPGEKEAEPFRSDLTFALSALRSGGRVLSFPSLEADPYQELEPHLSVACERVQALRALREPGEAIVVAPSRALIYPLAPPAIFDVYRFDLSQGQALRPDDLSEYLLGAGYLRTDLVSGMGEFSRRGGIIDFFPPQAAGAVRVEFWGEEVESLRAFDPQTQRSTARLERATIPPVREYPWDAAALEGLQAALRGRQGRRREAGATAALLAAPDELALRLEALAAGRTFP
ncbi:MAG TPA: hypothetical protein VFT43_10535, partial [Candidatus Polarisedimenticolia bacterium]|nr:hypothetical protein [Candidatus Polarisedimenticolia bacterium]